MQRVILQEAGVQAWRRSHGSWWRCEQWTWWALVVSAAMGHWVLLIAETTSWFPRAATAKDHNLGGLNNTFSSLFQLLLKPHMPFG